MTVEFVPVVVVVEGETTSVVDGESGVAVNVVEVAAVEILLTTIFPT